MRGIRLPQVMELHHRLIAQSGGTPGVLNVGALESALHQPWMTFEGEDLYPTIAAKAAALAFSIIRNHPFIDGNKRTGHAAMEVFLILNSHGCLRQPGAFRRFRKEAIDVGLVRIDTTAQRKEEE